MDPKDCLKCLLNLILIFWQGERVNSTDCEIGFPPQKPASDIQCYSASEMNRPVKKTCQLFSCRQKESIDWEMIDPMKGKLQVRFRGLPKSCNFQSYVVELEIYGGEPYEEGLACTTGNTSWLPHSRRVLKNTICSNCSTNSSKDCLQEHSAHFNYVYPGYYRLKITPYLGGSTRQAQRSYPFEINATVTNYVKKEISGLHLNASLQYRSASRELDLGIPIFIDPPDAMKIELKFSYDYVDLYGIVVHGSINSSTIRCEEKENIQWPSCEVQKSGLECKFYNLTQGVYSVYVSFTDDRCLRGTVWTGIQTDPCFWVIKKEFTDEKTVSDSLSPNESSATTQILYTSLIIIILIGVIVVSFAANKISKRRQKLANGIVGKSSENSRKNTTEQTYNFNGYAHKFNFGQFLTLTEKPRPEVLLVYGRDAQPFMELVACFRRVLNKIFKCQVYDYYDPDMWNEVSKDPKGWVYALIVERQAKLVVVAGEVASKRHRTSTHDFPELACKSPHPFDHLFPYAIRLIRDGMNEESYKNLFVVTFDGITNGNQMMDYFNPYMRFVIPKHLYKLFEHLHEPDFFKSIDISRLEEKQEVRQLRLQLDHLINLKLVGNSEMDARRSFDY